MDSKLIYKNTSNHQLFKPLKLPEKIKATYNLQRNVVKLRQSLGLLDAFNPKNKQLQKKILKRNRRSIINNMSFEGKEQINLSPEKNVPFSLDVSPIRNNSINSLSIKSKKRKDLTKDIPLYMDRLSTLKQKNQKLEEKLNKNRSNKSLFSYKEEMNINGRNESLPEKVNLPKINNNQERIFSLKTESNNNFSDKRPINLDNIKNKFPREKILPPIQNRNFNQKNKDNKSKNEISIDTSAEKEKYLDNNSGQTSGYRNNNNNISDNNSILISPKKKESLENKNKDYPNLDLYNKKQNNLFSLESEKKIGNKEGLNKFGYINTEIKTLDDHSNKYSRKITSNKLSGISEELLRKMRKRNHHVNEKIKRGMSIHELLSWGMESKFKYAQWRYGIADIEKYFIDLKEFGKPEEEELEKRKTFFDRVEDLIGIIKESKENHYLEEKYKEYGCDLNKEETKIKSKVENLYNDSDNAIKKQENICKVLKNVEKRKKQEQKSRDLLEEIMFQNKKITKNIMDS